ncbi:MAG: error-prone DNA polymerase, partial [Burkholderiaceae bacterium]
MTSLLPAYAELHCLSNFSFGRGASEPEELVERAHALGYAALAITDEASVAGLVRAHLRAKALGLPLLCGAEFALHDGPDALPLRWRLVLIARSLQGWGNVCTLITHARRAAPKGGYRLAWRDLTAHTLHDMEAIVLPQREADDLVDRIAWRTVLNHARTLWPGHLWLGVELLHEPLDDAWQAALRELSAQTHVPLVACGDVQMHVRSRKPLHDVLTAIRLSQPVAECGFALQPNAERHLRLRSRLARIYPPEWLAATVQIAQSCRFSLDELRYRYPHEAVPAGLTPAQALRRFCIEGARDRYPQGVPVKVQRSLVKELRLIAQCGYEMFFLTVLDVVRFARSQRILCQGRGSAANSVVCYCLGITAVDPMHSHLLLERFISHERRHEPPDIDGDFEHQRREEVIQYLYNKYGRERAALTATVIGWRTRSAVRGVGLALGLPPALVDRFAKEHQWFDDGLREDRMAEGALADELQRAGLSPQHRRIAQWLALVQQLRGFPRHLSQHVGGFVLSDGPLHRLVPIENAAMKDRTVIQWEKDDIEALGFMKVDVLALGMLSALRRCLDLRNAIRCGPGDRPWGLHSIPQEDAATYDMICRADTVGTFQIESRAQQSMLPRLRPRTFYDLVIEVAIVRPGPIQGGMVHPYLKARERRAQGLPIRFEKPALEPALGRTLGVPIFQEQVMQIAMIAAGFSAAQADALRRSMAAWKRKGGVHHFYQPIIDGMLARGYRREFAEGIFRQILGFGEYGFPESHAYSFALLAYASCWLKCHEPACFLAAMLNSQPMGFYSPSQLVQDARRHGVEVRPVDVAHSDIDCTLEPRMGEHHPAVRLGLRLVANFSQAGAKRLVEMRAQQAFASVDDLARRAALDATDLNALAAADALLSLAGHRRQQVWQAAALQRAPQLLRHAPVQEDALALPEAGEGESILFDYAATGLTLRRHPLALLRPRLSREQLLSAEQLQQCAPGRVVRACGIVTLRQQP